VVTRDSRRRVLVLGVVTVAVFATLFTRLGQLQLVQQPAYAARSQANRIRLVPVEAPRGTISDRLGRVLVDNRWAHRLLLDPRLPESDRPPVLARLSALLGVPEQALAGRLSDPRFRPPRPVPLADDVPEEVVVAVREHAEELPGVVVERHPLRRYPHGPLAAHLLGTVGEGGGRSGVEAAFERLLGGRAGAERLEVDSRGRLLGALATVAPRAGRDLRLTVDLDVQAAAEQALAERMGPVAAPGGAVVALDVSDGSALALASAPAFDPVALTGSVSEGAWAALHDRAAHAPLNNRAIQGLYAPGSTFKPVTALAGLETGAITPATVVEDRGALQVGGRLFRNAQGRSYGRVDLKRALAVSSDVYFYALGQRLVGGAEPLPAMARRLGLGRPPGIGLGSERSGRVPDAAWKAQAHRRLPTAFPDPRWYPGDSVNLAIGQGDLLVTPLQLALAYAALGNGGDVLQPRLTAPPGAPPAVRSRAGLDPAARQAVLDGLRAAVADPAGTAAAVFAGFPLDRFPVAGKTGTAQVAGHADTSLFAALVPAGAPRFAVVVVVEEAGFGSAVAAPVARRVIEALVASVGSP
jgi:penicillin-binding protein 2